MVQQLDAVAVNHRRQVLIKVGARLGTLIKHNVELAELLGRITTGVTVANNLVDVVVGLEQRRKLAGDYLRRKVRLSLTNGVNNDYLFDVIDVADAQGHRVATGATSRINKRMIADTGDWRTLKDAATNTSLNRLALNISLEIGPPNT